MDLAPAPSIRGRGGGDGGPACGMNYFKVERNRGLMFFHRKEVEKDVVDGGPRWFRWVWLFLRSSVL